MPRKAKARKVQIGTHKMTFGKLVSEMSDSNDLYDKKDFAALRIRLETEGYLFIRGVVPTEVIIPARKAMMAQAAKDNAIVVSAQHKLIDGHIAKAGSKWAEGYCVDGVTGSETNGRADIDVEAWAQLGPSKVCRDVYNGAAIQQFWRSLFGESAVKALVKQTFLRLMGSSGTVQHSDYYYFKRDTHIFSGDDGRAAQDAAKQFLKANDLWQPHFDEFEQSKNKENESDNAERKTNDDDEADLICGICKERYALSDLDAARRDRLLRARKKKSDFGMEGEWHCPRCAQCPLSIFTTWISLSDSVGPKQSVLAVVPGSHRLREWDTPRADAQLPGDFDWTLKWRIPSKVNFGDVIIFNIKTVHASSLNVSSPRAFRCSFDTRLQLVPVKDEQEIEEEEEEDEFEEVISEKINAIHLEGGIEE